jgi:MFS family permease
VSRTAATSGPTFRSALRERDFRLLLAGHGVGTVAQLVMTLAVGIEVLERTSSSLWVSVTVALGFAPYVIFSGYAGLLADRWSRSSMLTWSFVSRAGCGAVLAAGLLLHWPVPLLVGVAAVAAVLATPSYPALAAATLETVPDEQLPAANALVTGVENVTWMAGPGVLGLILLSGSGPTMATTISAGLFVAAGCLAARVRLLPPARATGADVMGSEVVGSEAGGSELWDGLRIVISRGSVRRPMTVAVIDNFLYGYLVVAMVLLADRLLGGAEAIGWLNAGLSVGAIAAMLVVNRLSGHRKPAPVLFAVMTVFAVATGLVGVSPWVPLTVGLVTVAGATTLIAEVMSVTLLQRGAGEDQAARVFGVYDQLNVGAIALGSLIAGPLADRFGPSLAIVVVAACALVASTVATGRMRDGARRAPKHAARPAHLRTNSTAPPAVG